MQWAHTSAPRLLFREMKQNLQHRVVRNKREIGIYTSTLVLSCPLFEDEQKQEQNQNLEHETAAGVLLPADALLVCSMYKSPCGGSVCV